MLGLKGTDTKRWTLDLWSDLPSRRITLGIKVVSMDFLLKNDEVPVIWRGPLKDEDNSTVSL